MSVISFQYRAATANGGSHFFFFLSRLFFPVIVWTTVMVSLFSPRSSLAQRSSSRSDTNASKVLNARQDDIHIENLGDLNSSGDEATPFIGPDGSMYFTSSRAGGSKNVIYVAKRVPSASGDLTSHWSEPEKFIELPGKQNISSLSIGGDGVTAVVGICNRPGSILESCDIYQGEFSNGTLENIVSLGKSINSEWWDAQPCISQDGQLLFFASDRKGGHGGIDIYMCSKSPEGKWSDPVNLNFNTSGDELSPFISRDNQTLYFAANHMPGGMGGFDIYITKRIGENEWTEPKNLGPAVNSKSDDLFFYVPNNEDAVYFASNRSGGKGGYDLYRVYVKPAPPKPKYVTLTGRLLDAETGQPITTRPEIEITKGNSSEILTNTASGPSYSVQVLAGTLVHIKAGAEAYVTNTMEVQSPPTNEPPVMTQDISLAPSHARIFGHVTNVFSHQPLHTTVRLVEMNGSSPTMSAETNPATGAYSFNINPLDSFKIYTSVLNYEPDSSVVKIPAAREKMIEVQKEIRLTPSAIETVMIFFDFDKSDLKPEEVPKFAHFIEQVKENPYVRIEVNGHTDSVGSVDYNVKLSERRAISVEDYLLSQDVPRDQLAVVKGFGKSEPLDPNDPSKNRRVEVRIVGKRD
jgi:outer membrane protein OmpA-like peptidoglycan-associated protein